MSENPENQTIRARFALKTDTTDNWENNEKYTGFIPLKGEMIIYQDDNKTRVKIGDGENSIRNLNFVAVETIDGIDIDNFVKKRDLQVITRVDFSGILSKDKWNKISSQYKQIMPVNDIKTTDCPIIELDLENSNKTLVLKEKSDWRRIDYANTDTGNIIFTCLDEKPDVDLKIVGYYYTSTDVIVGSKEELKKLNDINGMEVAATTIGDAINNTEALVGEEATAIQDIITTLQSKAYPQGMMVETSEKTISGNDNSTSITFDNITKLPSSFVILVTSINNNSLTITDNHRRIITVLPNGSTHQSSYYYRMSSWGSGHSDQLNSTSISFTIEYNEQDETFKVTAPIDNNAQLYFAKNFVYRLIAMTTAESSQE